MRALFTFSVAITCLYSIGEQRRPVVLADDPKLKARTVEEVKNVLASDSAFRVSPNDLVRWGAAAFSAYKTLLDDPTTSPVEICRIFTVLRTLKDVDRSQFVDYATRSLADGDWAVRADAVLLLQTIGSERDTAPIIALIMDDRPEVYIAAVKTVAVIGGTKDVVAMEIVIRYGEKQGWGQEMLKMLREQRDVLKKRLGDKLPKKP